MNLASNTRKALTSTVVVATIAWSMGLSALTASAATPASGSLIKASLPTVYYLGADNKRYVFPNQDTYKTWYADFSGVQTITDAELAALPLGGNVTFRPGVMLVKITTDPKTYAVSKGGVLRWIKTEAAAQALYGSTWNKMVKDVADSFFTNYTMGSDIASSADYSPATEMSNSGSINVDRNLATGSTPITTVSGTLTAVLSASQPMGATLPMLATGVTMVKVDVRNGGSSATVVDSITVTRIGPGSVNDFAGAYVYEGNNRLTTSRTLNSSTNAFSVGGLNLALAAGETKTLSIVADVNAQGASKASVGDVNAFQVTSIASGSSVAAGLPVTGPNFTLAGAKVGNVTITKGSTISNPKAGSVGAKVAEFKLAASSDEDIVLNKVVLYYAGSVTRSNITNLTLKQNGTTLASAAGLNSKDQAIFVLSSPLAMDKGTSRTFEVSADLAGTARTGTAESIKFYVETKSDIAAIGRTYGYGVTVNISSTDVPAGSYDGSAGPDTIADTADDFMSRSTLDGGQLVLTFNGPAAKNIATNAKDVELFNVSMAAASNLEIRKTVLNLAATTNLCTTSSTFTTPTFTDVKMVDVATGGVVATFPDAACGVSNNVTSTEVYNLMAGQTKSMKITADVDRLATPSDTIQVTFNAFGSTDVRNLDNNTYVSDIIPTAAISGNTHTVQTAGLTVSNASTPVSQTYILGTQGVALAGVNFKADDATDVRISTIKVVGASSTDVRNLVLSAGLWNGSTQVGNLKSPDTSGAMIFDNLNMTVAKGTTMTLILKGNLAGSGATPKFINFVIPTDDVDATDADSNSVAATPVTTNIGGTSMKISAGGSVTVALAADDTDSEAGLVVGGGTNVVLAKYKFSSTDEELKLNKVRFTTASAAGVSSMSLYDASLLVGGPVAVDGSGNADFSGVNFVIPKDGSRVLTVKANLNSVGSTGVAGGTDIKVALSNASGTMEIRGTSAGSSTLLKPETVGSLNSAITAITPNSKLVFKTKPTISLASLPSSTLVGGDQTVLRFTVSADAAGDVSFAKVTFKSVATTALTLPSLGTNRVLRRTGGDYLTATVATVSGNAGAWSIVLASEETVAAGTTKTYEIVMGTAVTAGTDSVSAYLLDDAAPAAVGSNVSSLTAKFFVWSDLSKPAHDATTGDWADGFKVKSLPTDSQTMTE